MRRLENEQPDSMQAAVALALWRGLAGWALRLVRTTERAPVERVVDDLDSIFQRRRRSRRAA